MGVFSTNYQDIQTFRVANPEANYDLNFLADLTHEEVVATHTGLIEADEPTPKASQTQETSESKGRVLERNSRGIDVSQFDVPSYHKPSRYQSDRNQYTGSDEFDTYHERGIESKSYYERNRYEQRAEADALQKSEYVAFYAQKSPSENSIAKRNWERQQKRERDIKSRLDRVPSSEKRRANLHNGELKKTTKSVPVNDIFLSTDHIPENYYARMTRNARNQGSCGSCWAFAAKTVFQNLMGGLIEISAQHILDCNDQYKCGGGELGKAFQLWSNFGFWTDAAYPYKPEVGVCKGVKGINEGGLNRRMDGSMREVQWIKTKKNHEIMQGVYNGAGVGYVTTLSVSRAWRAYSGGLFNPRALGQSKGCGYESGGHSVVNIGYVSNCGDYGNKIMIKRRRRLSRQSSNDRFHEIPCQKHWIIMNSWGLWWGLHGTVRTLMSDDRSDGRNQSCFCFKPGSICDLRLVY